MTTGYPGSNIVKEEDLEKGKFYVGDTDCDSTSPYFVDDDGIPRDYKGEEAYGGCTFVPLENPTGRASTLEERASTLSAIAAFIKNKKNSQ